MHLVLAGPAAADAAAVSGAVETFASYGVVGTVAIVLGLIALHLYRRNEARWTSELARERERADKAEAANAELNREIREKFIPVLADVARMNGDVLDALRDRRR